MSMTVPASVSSDGTRRVVWLDGGAADPEHVTSGEIASGLDVSLYLVSGTDGFSTGGDQASIPDSRLGSSQDFSKRGRKTKSLSTRYTFNDSVPADNEAKLELLEGTVGGYVELFQVEEDYDPTSDGYYVDYTYRYWPVELGEQNEMPSETNQVDRIQQGTFVKGPVVRGTIVAGS